MKVCYRCGGEVTAERVGVRDVCGACSSFLHCCRNCAFYEPGAHNDCREPNAEPVAEKDQGNFCDFFRFAERAAIAARKDPAATARAGLEALFSKKGRA